MSLVEPIRDRKKIARIKNLLRWQCRYRDLLLFVVGINIALRISDLLQLRIGHFLDDSQRIRGRFWIKEQKRGKRQEVIVNDGIRETLEEYLTAYPDVASEPEHFVSFNTKANTYTQPIRRGQAWKTSDPPVRHDRATLRDKSERTPRFPAHGRKQGGAEDADPAAGGGWSWDGVHSEVGPAPWFARFGRGRVAEQTQ